MARLHHLLRRPYSVSTVRKFFTAQIQNSSSPCISAVQQSRDGNPFCSLYKRCQSTMCNSESAPAVFKEQQIKSFNGLDQLKEQEIETANPHSTNYDLSVVKVYCTSARPDFSLPWQIEKQRKWTGSAFIIGDGMLLTNAHCVEYNTQMKVKRHGDDTKYIAKVVAVGVECDLALLSVESSKFWEGTVPIKFGSLPNIKDKVTVVGYPIGGKDISVTMGIVSRIEVLKYVHASFELLAIQIDAAINRGNSGGPTFNDKGECIGVAFQGCSSFWAENIGYLIPTTVVSHFLQDYQKNGKYTGFPYLGVKLQALENLALRAKLNVPSNVPSNEGVLVKDIEPTSGAYNVLKKGDVILSFDNIPVACTGTVPFRSSNRVDFSYLCTSKFIGDVAEVGIIREGEYMKVEVTLDTKTHLVPHHFEDLPSYLIVAGLVFSPLSQPLLDEEYFGEKVEAKAKHCMAKFKGEQIVILSQVLENDVNEGYEDVCNEQVVKLNGESIKNIQHLAQLVDSCEDEYLTFEFDNKFLLVLDREAALASSKSILTKHGIPSERSKNLLST